MIRIDYRCIFSHVTRNLEIGSSRDFQESHSIIFSVAISLDSPQLQGEIRNTFFASMYKIIVLLVKICIQITGIDIKIFSRFNMSIRAERLEKILLKMWMSETKTLLFFFFLIESHCFNIMITCITKSAFSNKAWHNINCTRRKGLLSPSWIEDWQSKFCKHQGYLRNSWNVWRILIGRVY